MAKRTIYQEILRNINDLEPEEKLELIRMIVASLQESLRVEDHKRSIMELKGLGKEIWQGIDAQEYVERERRSWD